MNPIHIEDDREDLSAPVEDWGAEVGKQRAKGINEVAFIEPDPDTRAMSRALNREPAWLRVGDRVWYWASFGVGPKLEAVITGISVKDGQLVYDCETPAGKRWGYADQFEKREEASTT